MSVKFRKYVFNTLLLSLGIGVLIQLNFLERIIDPGFADVETNVSFKYVFVRLFGNALVAWFTFIITYFVVRPLDRTIRFTVKKGLITFGVTLLSVYVLSDLVFAIYSGNFDFNFESSFFFKDLIMSIVIMAVVYYIKVFNDRQEFALENERLLRENIESQYESLRSQVSPHFLFNSLSALRALIRTDSSVAVNYLDHLSDVLRRTLKTTKEKTVTVEEELKILESYIFLVKMRYEDNLDINIDVPKESWHYKVPQLALQTLVENAVKHNVISNRHKMQIRIFVRDGHVIVENTLNKKEGKASGTGFGLANLTRQYRLISNLDIQIQKSMNSFRVELPLIYAE
ncbi:MAG: histidine kinase [Cyclobacteriaceae bacterium]